jgi:hypothetical protein
MPKTALLLLETTYQASAPMSTDPPSPCRTMYFETFSYIDRSTSCIESLQIIQTVNEFRPFHCCELLMKARRSTKGKRKEKNLFEGQKGSRGETILNH